MTAERTQQIENWASNHGVQGIFYDRVFITHLFRPRTLLHVRFQLPAPLADFVNRTEELTQLHHAVRHAGTDTVTVGIFGIPGVGKTTLAIRLANQLKPDFLDAQIMLNMLGTQRTPLPALAAMQAVVRAFHPDAALPNEFAAMQAIYRSVLSTQRVLIVADDAAHAAQIEPLMPPAGSLLIVTGRTTFTLAGMRAVHLQPFSVADARQLLLHITQQPIAPSTLDHLIAACARLPLALRIVATQLIVDQTCSPFQLNERLRQRRLAYLQNPNQPRDARASVQASIALSYDLLTRAEKRLLRSVSLLPVSFDCATAATLSSYAVAQTQQHLRRLVQMNLVAYTPEQQRYTVFELVREFAEQQLTETERNQRTTLLYRSVAQLLVQLEVDFEVGGSQAQQALHQFDLERPTIGKAWRLLRAAPSHHKHDHWLIQYGLLTRTLGQLRYHPRDDRIPQYQAMRAAAERQAQVRAQAIACACLGQAYAALGEYPQAIAAYHESLTLARQEAHQRGEAIVLGLLGQLCSDLGDAEQALAYHRASWKLLQQLTPPYPKGEALACGNLGYALACQGNPHDAVAYHQRQLALAEQRNDSHQQAMALSLWGFALFIAKQFDAAQRYLALAQHISIVLGDLLLQSAVHEWRGRTYAWNGQVVLATEYLTRARTLAITMEHRARIARTAWHLGEVLYQQGQCTAAAALAAEYLTFVCDTQPHRSMLRLGLEGYV